jgi:hypothetical protein
MDTKMKLALSETQCQKYLAWRKGDSNRPNVLTFLTMTGGSRSETETTAKSSQPVLSEEGIERKIKNSPLGFHTLDFSSDFWASLEDNYKLKGKVSDVLTYENIQKILIIRCNMSVPIGDYLERNIRSSISAEHQFTVGPMPDHISKDLGRPLLTAVFETKKGELGLLTIYPRITIVELNSRYGMIHD